MIASADRQETSAATEAAEATDNTEPALATQSTDPTEPIEATDSAEPFEPMQSTELLEAIESSESCDHSDHLDAPLDATEPNRFSPVVSPIVRRDYAPGRAMPEVISLRAVATSSALVWA
jgi:hypothetical protein